MTSKGPHRLRLPLEVQTVLDRFERLGLKVVGVKCGPGSRFELRVKVPVRQSNRVSPELMAHWMATCLNEAIGFAGVTVRIADSFLVECPSLVPEQQRAAQLVELPPPRVPAPLPFVPIPTAAAQGSSGWVDPMPAMMVVTVAIAFFVALLTSGL